MGSKAPTPPPGGGGKRCLPVSPPPHAHAIRAIQCGRNQDIFQAARETLQDVREGIESLSLHVRKVVERIVELEVLLEALEKKTAKPQYKASTDIRFED